MFYRIFSVPRAIFIIVILLAGNTVFAGDNLKANESSSEENNIATSSINTSDFTKTELVKPGPTEADAATQVPSTNVVKTTVPQFNTVTVPSAKAGSAVVTPNPYNVVIGLIIIIGLIFLLAWLARRIGPGAIMGGQSMKVLSALSVGPREKVVLVEIAGQQLLLGVAPGRVSHLKDFDTPVIVPADSAAGDFSAKFKRLLKQHNSKDTNDNSSSSKKQ